MIKVVKFHSISILEWNETFRFRVINDAKIDLKIAVYSKGVIKDDLIGEVKLSSTKILSLYGNFGKMNI